MKTQLLDARAKRISIAVAIVTGLIVVGAVICMLPDATVPFQQADGLKIIAAAHAYTRALVQHHSPVPHAVPLQALVDQGFLRPADIGSFQGMDAKIYLTASNDGPAALMRVHMPDGMDLVLLADGSMHELKREPSATQAPK